MCSIENLFTNKLNMMMSLQIYNTLSFALLCREKKGKFSDIENEFRIIAYDCPRIIKKKMEQMPREIVISGKIGVRYNGTLKAGEDTAFTSNLYTLNNTKKRLSTIIEEEQGKITINSRFKTINVCDIAENYRYLGGKKECVKYIQEMLVCNPEDVYVNRTYKIKDISDAVFVPGYQQIEY